MRKILLLITSFFLLMTILSGCSSQDNKYVILSISDTESNSISGISVFEENYPDGREIFPEPQIGKTDANGELKWTPDNSGKQKLTVGYFNSADEIEYVIVPVTVTKDDLNQHTKRTLYMNRSNKTFPC